MLRLREVDYLFDFNKVRALYNIKELKFYLGLPSAICSTMVEPCSDITDPNSLQEYKDFHLL